jgi:hypothetical protein
MRAHHLRRQRRPAPPGAAFALAFALLLALDLAAPSFRDGEMGEMGEMVNLDTDPFPGPGWATDMDPLSGPLWEGGGPAFRSTTGPASGSKVDPLSGPGFCFLVSRNGVPFHRAKFLVGRSVM